MEWYHYVLLVLKVVFLLEFFLILYDKKFVSQKIYISSEILFKLLLSIYIEYVVLYVAYKHISIEDQLFISFGSGLLMYDAIFNDLPKLLELYGIHNTSFVH